MVRRIIQAIDFVDKKYSRETMLLFAFIWGSYAIYRTMNPAPNFYDQFWAFHMIGLYGLYAMALGYTGIFIFWKQFSKTANNTPRK